MTVARRLSSGAVGLLGVLMLAGCQADPKDLQIQALNERVAELQRENEELRTRLARAITERDEARRQANALAEQVRMLQGERAKAPEGWVTSGPYTWTSLSTDFLFDSGKATLRPAARAALQQVVSTIQQNYPDMFVMVLGHTDTDPIKRTKDLWADNLDLSVNRGMTIFRELQKLGIPPNRMIAGGQGEWFPVATNATRAGKQQNRRVEIIVVPPRESNPASGGGAPQSEVVPPQ